MEILRKTQGINTYFELRMDEADPAFRYEEEMLCHNRFTYLPPLLFQRTDTDRKILYKIDGMTSLPRSWGAGGPGRTEVQRLLSDLAASIRELQDYMLPPEGLVLMLSCILCRPESGHALFLYGPEPGPAFSEEMKRLFEEIMPVYASEKEEELVWFYDLYSRFLDGSFTPEMLLQLVEQWKGDRTSENEAVKREAFRELPPPVDPEPYIISDAVVKAGRDSPRPNLYLVGGCIVLLAAAGFYALWGAQSLRISAVLVGAYVVGLVVMLLLKDGRPEAGVTEAGVAEPWRAEAGRTEPGRAEPVRAEPVRTEPVRAEAVRIVPDPPPTNVLHSRIRQLVPAEKGIRAPIYVSEGYCRIGRAEGENEYCIPKASVSRNHARLECAGDMVTLRDLGSTNGTYLNHVRLQGEAAEELHYGDVVSFAGEEFYVV